MLRIATAALALALATPVFADITITDPYARASGKNARAGAAFMQITNGGDSADRLIGVRSDAAHMVQVHTHIENDQGVMRMVHLEDGLEIPAGGTAILKRGGDHVMFMGLKVDFTAVETVPVTLIFEDAGELQVEIPVDLSR